MGRFAICVYWRLDRCCTHFAIGTDTTSAEPPRLADPLDDPDTFWLFTHPITVTGRSRFQNIRISDGSVLSTRDSTKYEEGEYNDNPTTTPTARFGN